MPNKIVPLENAILGHRPYKELEFREPKWGDYTAIGDPYVWARSPQDPEMIQPVPLPDRVRDYAERLIAEGAKAGDPLVLSQVSLRDSKAIESAICSFFLAVDPRMSAGSTASGKGSSSTSNGDRPPSES